MLLRNSNKKGMRDGSYDTATEKVVHVCFVCQYILPLL